MLDTFTLLVVLIVSNLLMAGAMWITFAGRFEGGLGPWTGSLIVQGFSWMLVAGRNDMPDFISVAVATAFLVYCWSLQVSALLEFHHKTTPRWLLYGPAVIAFLIVVIYVRDPHARLAVCGVGFGLAQFVTGAGLLYYRVSAEKRTRLLLAGSFFVMAGGLFWLAFTAWFEPESILPTFGPRPAPGGSLLAFYGVTIASSFAFLLMHKERGDREKHELATTDPLTGVYNRRTFKELAEPLLSRARRTRGSVSLLLLDLDHFKRINDTHGHLSGDEVLSGFARLARTCLRKEDLLARYGGEEFVVLLPGTSEAAAMALAERIREEVAEATLYSANDTVRVTVSVGLAGESGEHVATLETLLGRADEALYVAKARGRNCVVSSDPPVALAAAANG
jgi:diguanylate cyclase (GGDEF)-like protein